MSEAAGKPVRGRPLPGGKDNPSHPNSVPARRLLLARIAELEGQLAASAARVVELEARLVAIDRAADEREGDGGVITLEKMRRVFGQEPGFDVGATEKRLREWLGKDQKGYIAAMEQRNEWHAKLSGMEAELTVLRLDNNQLRLEAERRAKAVGSGPDPNHGRAMSLIEKLLVEAGK